jgi:hypothetical protein
MRREIAGAKILDTSGVEGHHRGSAIVAVSFSAL